MFSPLPLATLQRHVLVQQDAFPKAHAKEFNAHLRLSLPSSLKFTQIH